MFKHNKCPSIIDYASKAQVTTISFSHPGGSNHNDPIWRASSCQNFTNPLATPFHPWLGFLIHLHFFSPSWDISREKDQRPTGPTTHHHIHRVHLPLGAGGAERLHPHPRLIARDDMRRTPGRRWGWFVCGVKNPLEINQLIGVLATSLGKRTLKIL